MERRGTPWHDWVVLVGIIGILLSIWMNSMSSSADRGRMEQKVDDIATRVEKVEVKLDNHIEQANRMIHEQRMRQEPSVP